MNLSRISTPPTSPTLRESGFSFSWAHANGGLSEAEKRRLTELLAQLRKERER